MARPRKYSDELRRRAIEEVLERGRRCPDVARDLGIGSPETVRKWVRQAEIDRGVRPGPTTEELAEIKALRREVADQQRTIEILKAATTFFVQEADPHYGISRPTFYQWLRQFEEFGEEGLRDRSSRPRRCPHQTDAEVVGKIVYLRQHYHFGPAKITMYLARYHDVTISRTGVWRILKRLDMNRLPSSQRYQRHERRWKRYEKQLPGHRVQVDVKFIEPLAANAGTGRRKKRYYQFTAIDDCTRIRVLRIYERNTQKSAIQFLDYVLAKLPFAVEVVQTDNGAEFQGSFHWHLLDRGIGHTYIKVRTPRLNGKVERSHRIDQEEFYRLLDGVVIDDADVFNQKLQEWEDFYNFNRPHGGLDGQTPYDRLRQKTTKASA